ESEIPQLTESDSKIKANDNILLDYSDYIIAAFDPESSQPSGDDFFETLKANHSRNNALNDSIPEILRPSLSRRAQTIKTAMTMKSKRWLQEQTRKDHDCLCGEDVHCKYKDIYLNFVFSHLEVEKFVHQPRYESVEMFSYIGGYMGMWLGISLVALFDFAETLVALVTYMCRNKRKKKAVHSY
ncbi:hypothetical protein AVEN_160508-1, partial [Araneus ventricosus]